MISGTQHQSGLMAGAARVGSCGTQPVVVGAITPNHRTWHGSYVKPMLAAFAIDRPHPRPRERSP